MRRSRRDQGRGSSGGCHLSGSNSGIIELSVTQTSIRWFVVQCLYIISSHAVNQGFELGGEVRELGCISVEVRDFRYLPRVGAEAHNQLEYNKSMRADVFLLF